MIWLALTLPLLSTACAERPVIVANDPHNECDQCAHPDKPYTDSKVAGFIVCQAQKIDVCRALLGNPPRLK